MPISIYEAVTAGDCFERNALPAHAAWMAAHFSAVGTGVTNLPQRLPVGSLFMLDDQIPWQNHDAERICQELLQAVAELACSGILLDFEREPCQQTQAFCTLLCTYCRQYSIPLGMPPSYGLKLPAALFLPPLPCWPGPETVLQPFSGRELWLDAAESGCVAEIGRKSVQFFSEDPIVLQAQAEGHAVFWHGGLCCQYYSNQINDRIRIALYDTRQTMEQKLDACAKLGVTVAVMPWAKSGLLRR